MPMSFKLRITFFLLFFMFPIASFAQQWGRYACPNSYTKKSPTLYRNESQLYLIKVTSNKLSAWEQKYGQKFENSLSYRIQKADVLATYKLLSSQQNPSHQCVLTNRKDNDEDNIIGTKVKSDGAMEGVCKNLQSGSITSTLGGSGLEIQKDGNTQIVKCENNVKCIEDSTGNRIAIKARNFLSTATWDIDDSRTKRHIIKECSTGSIEAITLMYAFPGYVIVQRSVETGFVNTYQSAPVIKF